MGSPRGWMDGYHIFDCIVHNLFATPSFMGIKCKIIVWLFIQWYCIGASVFQIIQVFQYNAVLICITCFVCKWSDAGLPSLLSITARMCQQWAPTQETGCALLSARKLLVVTRMHRCERRPRRAVYGNGAEKKTCACVPQVKQGNMESNLSQHPEIVPVDKLISLNINAGCFIPDAAGSQCWTGMLWIQGSKFPPNHQIWQQRKTQIDCLNELNTHAFTQLHTHLI